MNINRFVCICCFLSVGLVSSRNQTFSQTLTAEQLDKIRRATVFITSENGQGTGFLMERNSDHGIITTAAHVIGSKDKETFAGLEVTFNSGTEFELGYKANVVGVDYSKDLAFLKVQARNLPEPVYLDRNAPILETQDVIVAGFPLGDSLAIGGRLPKISISKAAVASVRQGATDAPVVIQLDANLSPGNSGGPVFNRDGRVIGVIQSKVDDTQIGFALPASFVLDDLMGNVASVAVSSLEINGQVRTISLKGTLVDPMSRVAEVQMVTGSIEAIPSVDLRASKILPLFPHRRKQNVRCLAGNFFTALTLENQKSPLDEQFVQFVCKRSDGTEINSPPYPIKLLLEKSPGVKAVRPDNETSPPPKTPTPNTLPEFAIPESRKEANVVLTVEKVPVGTLPKDNRFSQYRVRSGILSQELKQDGTVFRRVMIPESTDYYSDMNWTNSGDQFLLHGKTTFLVDFPQAREIKKIDTRSSENWRVLRDNLLFLKNEHDHITLINLEKNQVESKWKVNRSFEVLSSSRAGNWLWRMREPKALYKASLNPEGVTRLELPNADRIYETDYRLSSDGSQLIERVDDRLTRYKVDSGRLEVSQSIQLEKPLNNPLTLQDSSTDQLLVLVAHNMILRNKDLSDRKSVVKAISSQNFNVNYSVEITDIILSTAVDKTRNQIVLAGTETLWFWSPKTGEVRSQSMLRSARVISGISMHPKGHTLAILCGSLTNHPSLYWMDADSKK